jgi:5,10-methylenetetrahydrofolate reductase
MTNAIGSDDAKSPDAMKRQHEAGLQIAKNIVDEIRKLPFKGVHIMAIAQEDRLAEIITKL